MYLQGELAGVRPFRVVVFYLAENRAVDIQHGVTLVGYNRIIIPLFALDKLEQFGRIAHRSDHFLLAGFVNANLLAPLSEDIAQRVLHQDAGPSAVGAKIGLGAYESFGVHIGSFFAVEVNSRIAALQSELQTQLKIFPIAARPDKEIILRNTILLSGLACDGSVFDKP